MYLMYDLDARKASGADFSTPAILHVSLLLQYIAYRV